MKTSVWWYGFIATMVCALFSESAFAAAGNPWTLPEDDMTRRLFIDYLFGPLLGVNETSPIGAAIRAFNSVMLFLGGILVAYTLIMGTLTTAHDGEVLGKKWSALYLPIRTVAGAAAVMPVLGGGFCVAQFIVLWLAMQGVQLANVMWEEFAMDPLEGSFYNTPMTTQNVRQGLDQLLLNNVCIESLANERSRDSALSKALFAADPRNVLSAGVGVVTNRGYTCDGDDTGTSTGIKHCLTGNAENPMVIQYGSGAYPVCGTAELRLNYVPGWLENKEGVSLLDFTSVGMLSNFVSTEPKFSGTHYSESLMDPSRIAMSDNVRTAQIGAFHMAQMQVNSIAKGIVLQGVDGPEDVNQAMNAIARTYSQTIAQAARAAYDQMLSGQEGATMREMLTRDGWLNAGAFYLKIATTQDQINRMASSIPVVHGSHAPQRSSSFMKENIARTERMLEQVGGRLTDGSNDGGFKGDDEGFWEKHGYKGMQARLNQFIVKTFINEDFARLANFDNLAVASPGGQFLSGGTVVSNPAGTGAIKNPVLVAKNLGDTMVAAALTSLGIGLVGGIIIGPGGFGVGSAAMLGPVFMLFFSALLLPGILLGQVLPVLPYILWIGVVLGWVILLIEAMIAAPLWAITHLAPDGDGVVGRGGQGYMLVLSLMLRPMLAVFGLLVAIALMAPIGVFINSTFLGAFFGSVASSATGLVTAIVGCVLYCVIMFTSIHRVFSLIHVVPDRLLRWIGGGGNELGEQATQFGGDATAKTVAGVGLMREMGSTARSTLENASMRKAQNKSTDAQTTANAADAAFRSEGKAQSARANFGAYSDDPTSKDAGIAKGQLGDSLREARNDNLRLAAASSKEAGDTGKAKQIKEALNSGDEGKIAQFARQEGGRMANDPRANAPWQRALARAGGEQRELDALEGNSDRISSMRGSGGSTSGGPAPGGDGGAPGGGDGGAPGGGDGGAPGGGDGGAPGGGDGGAPGGGDGGAPGGGDGGAPGGSSSGSTASGNASPEVLSDGQMNPTPPAEGAKSALNRAGLSGEQAQGPLSKLPSRAAQSAAEARVYAVQASSDENLSPKARADAARFVENMNAAKSPSEVKEALAQGAAHGGNHKWQERASQALGSLEDASIDETRATVANKGGSSVPPPVPSEHVASASSSPGAPVSEKAPEKSGVPPTTTSSAASSPPPPASSRTRPAGSDDDKPS